MAQLGMSPDSADLRFGLEARLAVERVAHGRAGLYSALADDSTTSASVREAAILLSGSERHLDEDDADEALRSATAALNLFRKIGDSKGAADAIRIILNAYMLQDQLSESWACATDELASFRAAGDKRGVARTLVPIAEVERKERRMADARRSASEARSIAAELQDASLEAMALLELAEVHVENFESSDALTCGSRALALSRELGDKKGEAQALLRLADANAVEGLVKEALQCAKDAHALLQSLGDRKQEAAALLKVARMLLLSDRAGDAAKSAKQCVTSFRASGFLKGEAAALSALVEAHIANEEASKAVEVAREEVEYFRDAGDARGQVAALEALVDALAAARAPQDAMDSAEEALALARSNNLRRAEAFLLMNIGMIHLDAGRLEESRTALQEARDIFDDLFDSKGSGSCLVGLARVGIAEGNFQEALEQADQARELFLEGREFRRAAGALSAASLAHRAQGNFEMAVSAALEAKSLLQDLGDHQGEAGAWLTVAEVRMQEQDSEKALLAARQARTIAQSLDGRARRKVFSDAIRFMASVHLAVRDMDQATAILKEGEAISKKDGTYLEQAQMKLLATQVYMDRLYSKLDAPPSEEGTEPKGKNLKWLFEVTLRKAQGAVKLARSSEDQHTVASALHTLASVYYFDHRVSETAMAAQEALDIFRELGDKANQVLVLALMGQSCLQKEDRVEAKRILEEAAALAKEAGDSAGGAFVAQLLETITRSAPKAATKEVVQIAIEPDATQAAPSPASAQVGAYVAPDPLMVKAHIIKMVTNMVGGGDGDVDGDTPLMDSGIDSLASVELRTQLQSEFKLNLPSTVMFNYPTISSMTDYLVDEATSKKVAWG